MPATRSTTLSNTPFPNCRAKRSAKVDASSLSFREPTRLRTPERRRCPPGRREAGTCGQKAEVAPETFRVRYRNPMHCGRTGS